MSTLQNRFLTKVQQQLNAIETIRGDLTAEPGISVPGAVVVVGAQSAGKSSTQHIDSIIVTACSVNVMQCNDPSEKTPSNFAFFSHG